MSDSPEEQVVVLVGQQLAVGVVDLVVLRLRSLGGGTLMSLRIPCQTFCEGESPSLFDGFLRLGALP